MDGIVELSEQLVQIILDNAVDEEAAVQAANVAGMGAATYIQLTGQLHYTIDALYRYLRTKLPLQSLVPPRPHGPPLAIETLAIEYARSVLESRYGSEAFGRLLEIVQNDERHAWREAVEEINILWFRYVQNRAENSLGVPIPIMLFEAALYFYRRRAFHPWVATFYALLAVAIEPLDFFAGRQSLGTVRVRFRHRVVVECEGQNSQGVWESEYVEVAPGVYDMSEADVGPSGLLSGLAGEICLGDTVTVRPQDYEFVEPQGYYSDEGESEALQLRNLFTRLKNVYLQWFGLIMCAFPVERF